ncbi:MAG: hypothetical protein QOJ09_1242 [Actinomycetota bacterium]|nr:hypothetical protein [Actinomycetota bacterium]
MLARMRRPLIVLLVVGCVLAGACGGGKGKKTAKSTTTTHRAATSTTPTVASGTAPLTGLPLADPAKAKRPALVVKIDNAPKARPQVGMNQADVVIEEKVEDGVTRFFTIFHSNDSDPVGPVRSARTTDIILATSLHRPLFAYSGTNATFQQQVDRAPLVDVGVNAMSSAFFRQSGRPAPYNLFSRTSALFQHAAPQSSAPPALFPFRANGQALTGSGPSTGVHIEFVGKHITTVVDYGWDAGAGTWPRVENGTPHTDGAGRQVAPKNVVVQLVTYKDTGQTDRSGTSVPEAELIGNGEAWILTDGKVVKGTWSKPTADAVTAFKGPDGKPVPLTPGQTWVELAPVGSARLK